MSWNYRVIQTTHEDEVHLDIHEVYYDETGKVRVWSVEPAYVGAHSKEDLLWVLKKMKAASNKPFLKVDKDKLVEI